MWPPTGAVLQHHEQHQRHTHDERAIAIRQDEEQEIFHRAPPVEARYSAPLRAVALLRYGRWGSDHRFNVAGHAPQIDGQS